MRNIKRTNPVYKLRTENITSFNKHKLVLLLGVLWLDKGGNSRGNGEGVLGYEEIRKGEIQYVLR